MAAAGLIEGEKVQIVNNNNGERIETYVIKGERGSGCICLNGAAARKTAVGDIVIIMGYGFMDFEEAKTFQPKVVFPDERTNRILLQVYDNKLERGHPSGMSSLRIYLSIRSIWTKMSLGKANSGSWS